MTANNVRKCTCGEQLGEIRIHGCAGAIPTEGRLLRCVSDECRKAYILEDDVWLLEICGACYELLEECHCDQGQERLRRIDKARGQMHRGACPTDQGEEKATFIAEAIVNAIIVDMAGRGGLLETWEATTPAVRAEVRQAWIRITLAYI